MDKQQLRALYRKKREELSEEEIQIGSKKITDFIFANFSFNSYTNIHIFLPIASKKEVNTWLIIEALRNKHPHVKILIPKMDGENIKTYVLDKNTRLEENRWGIPEPVNAEEYPSEKIDFIFIPLLAFDLRGHRIGYGRGFYDRFLKTCNVSVIKMGLSFFDPEVKINEEAYDVALDYCVTPREIYSF